MSYHACVGPLLSLFLCSDLFNGIQLLKSWSKQYKITSKLEKAFTWAALSLESKQRETARLMMAGYPG